MKAAPAPPLAQSPPAGGLGGYGGQAGGDPGAHGRRDGPGRTGESGRWRAGAQPQPDPQPAVPAQVPLVRPSARAQYPDADPALPPKPGGGGAGVPPAAGAGEPPALRDMEDQAAAGAATAMLPTVDEVSYFFIRALLAGGGCGCRRGWTEGWCGQPCPAGVDCLSPVGRCLRPVVVRRGYGAAAGDRAAHDHHECVECHRSSRRGRNY